MKRVTLNQSPRVILNRHSAFTLARLRTDANLTPELTQAQEAHDALYAASQDREATEREIMAAIAARETRRYALHVSLRSLRVVVLAALRDDRSSPLYRAVFPGGFSAALKGSAAVELSRARQIVARLPDPQPPEISEALNKVRTAIDLMAEALAGCETAKAGEQAASAALVNEKVRFVARYDEIYSRLIVALGSRRLAETYFWQEPRSGNADDEVPARAEEPAPVTRSLTAPQPVPTRSPAAPGSSVPSPSPETEEAAAA